MTIYRASHGDENDGRGDILIGYFMHRDDAQREADKHFVMGVQTAPCGKVSEVYVYQSEGEFERRRHLDLKRSAAAKLTPDELLYWAAGMIAARPAEPPPPTAGTPEVTDLHVLAMNMRCNDDVATETANSGTYPYHAYKLGHRDARHAIAEALLPVQGELAVAMAKLAEALKANGELAAEYAKVVDERDALARFKAYVHKRLDDSGVPVDPESPHKAEGCRIGGRLDWIFAAFANVLDMQRELAEGKRLIEKVGLEKSADGVWLIDCEKLFCPKCAGECRTLPGPLSPSLCDNCTNPDDCNLPPRPWFESWCYSTREAALAAIAAGAEPGSSPTPPAAPEGAPASTDKE